MNFYITFFVSISDWLLEIDRSLFTFIHARASSPAIDRVMLLLREPLTWIPLYAFLLYWILRYRRQVAWQFILLSLVTFAITDFTSASLLKPLFARVRPCYDPELQEIVRNILGCGGKYGMPSTHASNHFGLSGFWYFTISWMGGRKWSWLWFWAIIVCYAQVYVGKHYPFDILIGAILGMAVGMSMAVLFRKWLPGKIGTRTSG